MSTDLLAAGAVAIGTLALTLAFYRLIGRFEEGEVSVAVSGWHFGAGLLPWILILAAATATWMRRVPRSRPLSRWVAGGVATVAGGLAVVTSIIALLDPPDGRDLAEAAYTHVAREELFDIATQTQGWMSTGSEVQPGVGPFLLLIAALLSLAVGIRVVSGSRS